MFVDLQDGSINYIAMFQEFPRETNLSCHVLPSTRRRRRRLKTSSSSETLRKGEWPSSIDRLVVLGTMDSNSTKKRCTVLSGWCSTLTLLLMCSSSNMENCHPLLIRSSLSTAQLYIYIIYIYISYEALSKYITLPVSMCPVKN